MANKTTVSNPYNFNISSNVSFSTTINAVLPDEETILYDASGGTYDFKNLTIPSGVRVVKVYCYAEIIEQNDGLVAAYVGSYVNDKLNKVWGTAKLEGIGIDESTKYVGVTPGKTYRLSVVCHSESGGAYLSISYSNEINAHAVDVEDY